MVLSPNNATNENNEDKSFDIFKLYPETNSRIVQDDEKQNEERTQTLRQNQRYDLVSPQFSEITLSSHSGQPNTNLHGRSSNTTNGTASKRDSSQYLANFIDEGYQQ